MQNMSSAIPDWHNQAACSTYDWYLWELLDEESPLTASMTKAEMWSFNDRNHELAVSICLECPVMVQCAKAASKEDFKWTVRGGEKPFISIGNKGDRSAPKCNHRRNISDPRARTSGYKVACEDCARAADKKFPRELASKAGSR